MKGALGVGAWELGLIVALLYVTPLFLNAPLTDPDEGLHAAISQEMVERGDYVVPRFLGRPFLDKPILFFWAQAASLRVFGMSTAAARLPGVVFAFLSIATTGWLAAFLFGRRAGWIAAFCYATMVLPFLLALAPVHDIVLVPMVNLALGFLWRSRWVAAGLILGLSVLTKGLEGVAIAGVAFGAHLIVSRQLTWPMVLRGALVLALAFAVAMPWYLAMNAREPGYLYYYFVDRHLLGFATDTQRHSGQPWWYYLPLVIGGGLPWIAFTGATSLKSSPNGSPRMLWTWLLGTIVLLSVSASKAVTYVLPAMPAIAILAARSAVAERVWRPVAAVTTIVCLGALVLFGPALAKSHSSRDLADDFNDAPRLPATIFVFDQRVSFVYYLTPEVRRQMHADQVRSVSVEELADMQPFPPGAVLTVPADLAGTRLPRIPALHAATSRSAGRYLVIAP